MRRAVGSGLTAAIIVLAMLAGASAASAKAHASRGAKGLGVLVPKTKGERLPLHGGTADSLNWSGYAVTPSGGGITAVSSTFTVPSAGLVPPGFAATWTGIGGYNTSDLIQAGTAEQSAPDNPLLGPQYYAWYELLPASETQLTGCTPDANCTVTPGDNITVNIKPGVRQHLEHLDDQRRQVELEPERQLHLVGVLGRVDPRGADARRPDDCWRMSAPSTSDRPRRTPPAA